MQKGIDTICYLCGTNVDKRQDSHNRKLINRDHDIKDLIKKGKFPFFKNSLVLLIALFIIDFLIFFEAREIFEKITGTAIIAINIVLLLMWILHVAENLKHITESSLKTFAYLRYAWSSSAVKNPLDMWSPITNSGISDAQVAMFQLKLLHNNSIDCHVPLIYSGEPYFNIKAIDSITISWKQYWPDYFFHRNRYRHLLKEYAIDIIKAFAQNREFKLDERQLCISNSVFGILFMSKYLKMQVNQLERKRKEEGESKKSKINVHISDKFEYPMDKGEGKDKKEAVTFAEEFMKMCSTPEFFEWDKNREADLTICSVDFIDSKPLEGIFKITKNRSCRYFSNMVHKRIRIPVKRYIAIPRLDNENRVLNKILDPDRKDIKGRNIQVNILGGAEQNLGLLYYINKHRWSGHGDLRIGIAENALEEYSTFRFKVGSEGFVYGIANFIKQRQDLVTEINKYAAEIFTFELGENEPGDENTVKFYCVYGYNAPITKIASFNLLNSLCDGKSEYIPGCRQVPNNCLKYEIDRSKLGLWDKYDVLNMESWDERIKGDLLVNINDI